MGGLRSFYHHLLNRVGLESDSRENGLTLIELMVVVVILGIISAVAIPSISSAITNAKVSTTESDLATIQQALQRYYVDHGAYPQALTPLTQTTTGTNGGSLGPYLDVQFPYNDAWGKPIWYGPLNTSTGGAITGYYLYSMGGVTISTKFGGSTIPIGSIIAGGGTANPSTNGEPSSKGNTTQTPFVYTAQDYSNQNALTMLMMYNWGSLNPSLSSGSAGRTEQNPLGFNWTTS